MIGVNDQGDEAMKRLVTAYLAKPFAVETLMLIVRRTPDEAQPAVPCVAEA